MTKKVHCDAQCFKWSQLLHNHIFTKCGARARDCGARKPAHHHLGWFAPSLLLLLSRFSRIRLRDPMDGSPPGSPVPGIIQARTLEWVAISFSNAWKWKVKMKSLSRVRLLETPWTAAYQAPPSMGFSRQEYWSGVPSPSPLLFPYRLLNTNCEGANKIQNCYIKVKFFPRQL